MPRYRVEDYNQWQGDWELWDGIAISMSPIPFGRHQRIVAALVGEIRLALQNGGCDSTVFAELDWIISDDTVVRPDLLVVCGRGPDEHLRETPERSSRLSHDRPNRTTVASNASFTLVMELATTSSSIH